MNIVVIADDVRRSQYGFSGRVPSYAVKEIGH